MDKKATSRFPDYEWYCFKCKECLNSQVGFDDHKTVWKCTNCGHKTSISKDNLRKPYAYLKNTSATNKIIAGLLGVFRSIYGFLFRTSFYCLIAFVIVLATRMTSLDHLSLGTIIPKDIEDYFCAALYCSGFAVLILLALYALFKRFIGRPDTKKHFLRETILFFRDSLLYPINVITAIFKHLTVSDTILSVLALLIMVATFGLLGFGCLHWL